MQSEEGKNNKCLTSATTRSPKTPAPSDARVSHPQRDTVRYNR